MSKWTVLIIHTKSKRVDLTMKDMGHRHAQKVEAGANINLDHVHYHTELIEQEEEDNGSE